MRRLRRANRKPAGNNSQSTGSRNDQICARGFESSVQIYDPTDCGKPVRFFVDVGFERVAVKYIVVAISGTRAGCLRRQAQLPDRCSKLSMVALHRADVYSYQPDSHTGQHVQPADGWTTGGKAVWLGEVCSFLGGDWHCRSAGQLYDGASATRPRSLRTFHL